MKLGGCWKGRVKLNVGLTKSPSVKLLVLKRQWRTLPSQAGQASVIDITRDKLEDGVFLPSDFKFRSLLLPSLYLRKVNP